MARLIAVLRSEHSFVASDGCAGAWAVGDVINIEYGQGSLDYVRKGVMVQTALENHFHVVPLANLLFYLDDGVTKTPVNHDRLFSL